MICQSRVRNPMKDSGIFTICTALQLVTFHVCPQTRAPFFAGIFYAHLFRFDCNKARTRRLRYAAKMYMYTCLCRMLAFFSMRDNGSQFAKLNTQTTDACLAAHFEIQLECITFFLLLFCCVLAETRSQNINELLCLIYISSCQYG